MENKCFVVEGAESLEASQRMSLRKNTLAVAAESIDVFQGYQQGRPCRGVQVGLYQLGCVSGASTVNKYHLGFCAVYREYTLYIKIKKCAKMQIQANTDLRKSLHYMRCSIVIKYDIQRNGQRIFCCQD